MPKTMKVIFFQISIGKGGATRSNIKIIELLKDKGFDVALVARSYPEDSGEHPGLKKIKYHGLEFASGVGSIIPLISFIKKNKPGVVVGGMLQSNIVLMLSKILGFLDCKTILIDRVNPSKEIDGRKGFAYRLLPYLIKFLYPRADALVSVSSGTRDNVLSISQKIKNIRVIYNPVVTKDKLAMSYEKVSHPWMNSDIPLLVSVGRLVKQKDFKTLIHSVSLVVEKLPVRLLILGEGEEKESLLCLIRDLKLENHVSLLGHVSNPHPFLRNCELFVLSSAWEGFGNVLVEAMSYGTSVVSTDCPSGPSEILNNGEFGSLVPVGNCDFLAESILYSLKNPHDPSKLINRALEFNEEAAAENYMNLLDELIDDNKRR